MDIPVSSSKMRIRSNLMDHSFVLSLDLGQKRDFSTAVIVERAWALRGVWTFLSDQEDERAVTDLRSQYEPLTEIDGEPFPLRLLYLDRWARGTSYVDIVADVTRLLEGLMSHSRDDAVLILDATGVGAGVLDMLKRKRN